MTDEINKSTTNQDKKTNNLQNGELQPGELNRGFKFRVAMTIVFFILSLVYILWLLKMV